MTAPRPQLSETSAPAAGAAPSYWWVDLLPEAGGLLDGHGVIVAVNDEWHDLAAQDATPCHALGVGDNFLTACGDVPAMAGFRAELERVLASGHGGRASWEYAAPTTTDEEGGSDGLVPRWYAVLVKATPTAGALVSVRDVTAYRRTEEGLRHRNNELAAMTRSLKQTNEELDQYAYVTSHDLKAPLRGIANLSSWIEEDLGDVVTDEAHHQLELLRGRVHRMEALIDGILAYARVGRVRVRAETVDVGALLRDMADLLAPPPGFRVEIAPGMPTVVAERTRLQQVFMNLISNAIKHHHHPARGHVRIAHRDLGDRYEFSVADDGPGIDPAYHQKVWVIFQTLRPRDQVEGTGVGLSLVKKIVEDQGGAVRLESEPGRGATFSFTWQKDVRTVRPRAAVARRGVPAAAPPPPPPPPEQQQSQSPSSSAAHQPARISEVRHGP